MAEGIRMELKYCECCGGLLLRRAGSQANYCVGCALLINDLAPRKEGRRRAEAGSGDGRVIVRLGDQAVAESGGHGISLEAAVDTGLLHGRYGQAMIGEAVLGGAA